MRNERMNPKLYEMLSKYGDFLDAVFARSKLEIIDVSADTKAKTLNARIRMENGGILTMEVKEFPPQTTTKKRTRGKK